MAACSRRSFRSCYETTDMGVCVFVCVHVCLRACVSSFMHMCVRVWGAAAVSCSLKTTRRSASKCSKVLRFLSGLQLAAILFFSFFLSFESYPKKNLGQKSRRHFWWDEVLVTSYQRKCAFLQRLAQKSTHLLHSSCSVFHLPQYQLMV